jgi:hypothetical protein
MKEQVTNAVVDHIMSGNFTQQPFQNIPGLLDLPWMTLRLMRRITSALFWAWWKGTFFIPKLMVRLAWKGACYMVPKLW